MFQESYSTSMRHILVYRAWMRGRESILSTGPTRGMCSSIHTSRVGSHRGNRGIQRSIWRGSSRPNWSSTRWMGGVRSCLSDSRSICRFLLYQITKNRLMTRYSAVLCATLLYSINRTFFSQNIYVSWWLWDEKEDSSEGDDGENEKVAGERKMWQKTLTHGHIFFFSKELLSDASVGK